MPLFSERGSMIPLGIGVIALTLILTLVFAELTGVSIQTLRNKQLADVLSLKVASDLLKDGVPPVVGLDYLPTVQGLLNSAANHLAVSPTRATVLSFDGQTLEGEICTQWRSVTGLTLGQLGVVCAKSKARAVA